MSTVTSVIVHINT